MGFRDDRRRHVGTSALMAVLLDEPLAQDCADALQAAGTLMISAGTVAEALIVADRRGLGAEMRRLIDGLGLDVAARRPRAASVFG